MLDKELLPCLEAVLFATGEPIELERLALGLQTDEAVLENVVGRDYIDENRAESPLRRADDAVDLDNSNMTIEEQNEWLYNLYNSIINKLA